MYVYVYFLEFVLENSEDYTLIFDIYLFNILGSFQINMKFLSLNISQNAHGIIYKKFQNFKILSCATIHVQEKNYATKRTKQ